MRKLFSTAMLAMCLSGFANAQTLGVQRGDEAQNKQQSPTQQPAQPDAKSPILEPGEPVKQEQARRHGEQRHDSVRTAETVHDEYEATIANFTVVLAGATLLLMVATGALWWETRKLAKFAGQQAQDTQKALKTAKEAADAATVTAGSTRAWLTFGAAMQSPFGDSSRLDGFSFSPSVRNAGRTPAISIETAFDTKKVAANDEVPLFDVPEEPNLWHKSGVIGPGLEFNVGVVRISLIDLQEVIDNSSAYYIANFVRYRDVHDPERQRETRHITRLIPTGHREMPGLGRVPYFATAPVGDQNLAT